MIKIILFDADGVIIRGEMFSTHLARDYGITKEITADFFTRILPECVIGKKDLKVALLPFLEKWGWKGTVEEFIHYWHTSEHNIDNELIEYIQNFREKGIICCLATNQTKNRASYMLKEMGFEKIFYKVYASANLGTRKPEQEFYEKVILDLKVEDKNEVLFWDDSEENIQGAKQFGIHAEFYKNFEDFKRKMSDVYHYEY